MSLVASVVSGKSEPLEKYMPNFRRALVEQNNARSLTPEELNIINVMSARFK